MALALALPETNPQKAVHKQAARDILGKLNAKLFLAELDPH